MLKAVCLYLMIFMCTMNIGFADNRDVALHKQALSIAKAGDYKQAISLLSPLVDKYPKPNRFFYDYLQVLSWAGHYQDVTRYFKQINLSQAPLYVLKTLAFSFRQQKEFIQAQRIYQLIVRRFPKDMEGNTGLALVYIDQKKFKPAERLIQKLERTSPENRAVLNAHAYLFERKKQWLSALYIYQKILAHYPNDNTIYRKKILTLNRIGASHLAYDMMTDPQLFSKQELALIRDDRAAHQVRWGLISVDKPEHRFDETDKAISEIKKNNKQNRQLLGEKDPLTLTGQFDLLLALRNRTAMKEVLALNRKLKEMKVKIPAYAKNGVCDAYLYEQMPRQAINCYQQVIQSGYPNLNSKLGLFYAYLENENYHQAQQLINKLAKTQPTFVKGIGKKKIIKPNFKKLQTATVKTLGIAFADDLEQAQTDFEWMNHRAPYNLDIRDELANIYYWRGWARKAQEEYEIGLYQNPKHLGLRLGQTRNALELKQYKKAEQAIAILDRQYPENKGVTKQKRLWDIHNMREFKTEINWGLSSGSTNGSRDFNIDSYLFSAPLDYHYRFYLHHRYSHAALPEGRGLLNHTGIGGEYSAPDIRITGELHKSHYGNNRLGLSLSGEYAFDDYLSSSLSLESISKDTPLRALHQGVVARSATVATQYRWHESRTAGLSLAYLNFSDHNQRKSISGFWRERWYNQYDYKFSTRVDVYHSSNSKKNRIYFNPDSDFSAGIAFENDWLTWKKYDDTLHQRLILSTGTYHQQYFSSGSIWGIQYEHRWQARKRFELVYGIKRASARYDGNDEYTWNYYMTLDWKF